MRNPIREWVDARIHASIHRDVPALIESQVAAMQHKANIDACKREAELALVKIRNQVPGESR